jgi:hypothetical protein
MMEERLRLMMKISLGMMENTKGHTYFMRRLFMSAAAVIAMAVGCQKLNNHVKPGNQQDDNDGRPVAVKFKSNVVNVQTRASLTGLNGSNDLYIHGLNRSKPGVGEIINAKAHMAKPSGAEDGWSVAEGSLQFAD